MKSKRSAASAGPRSTTTSGLIPDGASNERRISELGEDEDPVFAGSLGAFERDCETPPADGPAQPEWASDPNDGDLPFQAEMEQAFGMSFGHVSVSLGDPAAAEAGAHGTYDGRVVRFADANPAKETVAHELAHVAQRGGRASTDTVESTEHPAEVEAEAVAKKAAAGQPVAVSQTRGTGLHREAAPAADPAAISFSDADNELLQVAYLLEAALDQIEAVQDIAFAEVERGLTDRIARATFPTLDDGGDFDMTVELMGLDNVRTARSGALAKVGELVGKIAKTDGTVSPEVFAEVDALVDSGRAQELAQHECTGNLWVKSWQDAVASELPMSFLQEPRAVAPAGTKVKLLSVRAKPDEVAVERVEITDTSPGLEGYLGGWVMDIGERVRAEMAGLAPLIAMHDEAQNVPSHVGTLAYYPLVAAIDERRGAHRLWTLRALDPVLTDDVKGLLDNGDFAMMDEVAMEERLQQIQQGEWAEDYARGPLDEDGFITDANTGRTEMEDSLPAERRNEIAARAAIIEQQLVLMNPDMNVINDQVAGLNRYELDVLESRVDGPSVKALFEADKHAFIVGGYADGSEEQEREGQASMEGDRVAALVHSIYEAAEDGGKDADKRLRGDLAQLRKVEITLPDGTKVSGLEALEARLLPSPALQKRWDAAIAELDGGDADALSAARGGDLAGMQAGLMRAANSVGDVAKECTPQSAAAFHSAYDQSVVDYAVRRWGAGVRPWIQGLVDGNQAAARAGQSAYLLDKGDDSGLLGVLSAGSRADNAGMERDFDALASDEEGHTDADDTLRARLDARYGPLSPHHNNSPMLRRMNNDRILMHAALVGGTIAPARQVYFGLFGEGSPSDAVKALAGRTREANVRVAEDYDALFARDLQCDILDEAKGQQLFDLIVALYGVDPSPEEMRRVAELQWEHLDAWINIIDPVVLEGYIASIRDATRDRIYLAAHDRYVLVTKQEYTDEELQALREDYSAFNSASGTYAEARKALAATLAMAGSISVGLVATFVTGGAAAPWLCNVLSGAASIGTKAATLGDEYGAEEIGRDVLMEAIGAALSTKAIGGRLADVEKALGSDAMTALLKEQMLTSTKLTLREASKALGREVVVRVLAETSKSMTKAVLSETLDAIGLGGDGEFNTEGLVVAALHDGLTGTASGYARGMLGNLIAGRSYPEIDSSGKVFSRTVLNKAVSGVVGAEMVSFVDRVITEGVWEFDTEAVTTRLMSSAPKAVFAVSVDMLVHEELSWEELKVFFGGGVPRVDAKTMAALKGAVGDEGIAELGIQAEEVDPALPEYERLRAEGVSRAEARKRSGASDEAAMAAVEGRIVAGKTSRFDALVEKRAKKLDLRDAEKAVEDGHQRNLSEAKLLYARLVADGVDTGDARLEIQSEYGFLVNQALEDDELQGAVTEEQALRVEKEYRELRGDRTRAEAMNTLDGRFGADVVDRADLGVIEAELSGGDARSGWTDEDVDNRILEAAKELYAEEAVRHPSSVARDKVVETFGEDVAERAVGW